MCLKYLALWPWLCARYCARPPMNGNIPFFHRIQGTFSMLLPKIIHSLRIRSMRGRRNYAFFVTSSSALLTPSFGRNGELWCAGGLKFSYYIPNLDKKFDIKTATIIFLFSSLKVTARLRECLPSFPPGGKLCDWVINTLMDPAGTVSCNLICKEIIWVIDGDEQFLSDKRALSLALQKTFKSFIP